MRRLLFKTLVPAPLLCITVMVLSARIADLPPLGRLLDPFTGIVQNESPVFSGHKSVNIPAKYLSDSVSILFDEREVPHVYASNTGDLYFAQGYVSAHFRLWQMDFMSLAAAGRLSEIFGESRLDQDRMERRLGIPAAAEASLEWIKKDPVSYRALQAYTEGVNAYIGQLRYGSMPLEYKCLGYRPEPWSELKSVLVMKYVSAMLSGFDEDEKMTRMMLSLGESEFNKLFPEFPSHFTPVADGPAEKTGKDWSFLPKPRYLDSSFLFGGDANAASPFNPNLGSNSWAISGKKTKTGYPILCNDPHLGLTLPAIWLEMQLAGPGENVYGVSIPGIPAILIGFNRDIAWGMTNGEDDVKDWYKLKYSADHQHYQFDGKWLDLQLTVEHLVVKGRGIYNDTIGHSLHGPIVFDHRWHVKGAGHEDQALGWGLSSPSNEILTFIELNRAKNYDDYLAAIAHYSCPVQNFTFASRDNTIAINHQGKMAVKWPGQGKFILDGSRSNFLYSRDIPADSLPYLFNPECGYVLSANQHPTTKTYPYYYNGRYMENRANRIRQWMDSSGPIDIKRMEEMQLDDVSPFATEALPVLVRLMNRGRLSGKGLSVLDSLSTWDGAYRLDDRKAILYNLWWKNVRSLTWDEPVFSAGGRYPDDFVLLDMLRDEPSNRYFGKYGGSGTESAADIVREAFGKAVAEQDTLQTRGISTWGIYHKVYINHLLGIGAFGRRGLPSAGFPDVINAVSDSWGPSWRMIVELGDRPKGFGIYPGGQSGNPGSAHYDDFVGDWLRGRYFALKFYVSMSEAMSDSKKELTLNPQKNEKSTK